MCILIKLHAQKKANNVEKYWNLPDSKFIRPSLSLTADRFFNNDFDKPHEVYPQKKAARRTQDVDHRRPSLTLFLKLNWLPFYERFKYFRWLTVYKALIDQAPQYVSEMLKQFSSVHNKNTRGSKNVSLVIPKIKSNSGKRIFNLMASTDGNSLDEISNALLDCRS